jgi:hypothetical protein
MLRPSYASIATNREGHRSRARSLETPQQLALRLFQAAPRPHRDCRSLRQLLKCEHTLQSFSDQLRPQTNIHSSARPAAQRTRARFPINLKAIDDALHNGCSRRCHSRLGSIRRCAGWLAQDASVSEHDSWICRGRFTFTWRRDGTLLVPLLSRFARPAGLVTLRQTFARRSH